MRSNRHRRNEPFWYRYRVLLSVLAVCILAVFLCSRFYHSVQHDRWKEEDAAVERAKQETNLTEADQVEEYIGDEPYTVIYGKDRDGKKIIVWVGKDEIKTKYSGEGVSKTQLKHIVLKREPGADILRMTPGVTKAVYEPYIWEVFYKKPQEKRYYYGIYRFENGEWLRNYKLSKH